MGSNRILYHMELKRVNIDAVPSHTDAVIVMLQVSQEFAPTYPSSTKPTSPPNLNDAEGFSA
jgi:hypothetical protein